MHRCRVCSLATTGLMVPHSASAGNTNEAAMVDNFDGHSQPAVQIRVQRHSF